MTALPYQPQQLSQSDVEVLQELILSKRTLAFSKEKNTQKIRFLKRVLLTKESSHLVIALNINGEKIDLALQATPESSLAHQLLELGGVENIPQEFVAAIKAFYSKEIINAFEHFFGVPVALWKEGDAVSLPEEKRELFFEIFQNENAIEAQGSITLSPFLLTKLLQFASNIPAVQELRFNTLSLEGEVVIGRTTLSLADWNRLSVGALIFLKPPTSIVTGEASFLFGEKNSLPFAIDVKQASALVVSLSKIPFDPSPLLQQKSSEQVDSRVINDQITVDLNVSAATLILSIEEILLLAKSKKTNKLPKLLQPLKIIVQGSQVGVGELVAIHDQHALFVTQLNTGQIMSKG